MQKQLDALDKQMSALKMRINGVPYIDIARKLGYSGPPAAYNAVKAALKKTLSEPANELRAIDLARLDDMYNRTLEIMNRKHYVIQGGNIVLDGSKKIENPEPILKSIATLTRILERRASLMGLDTPKVIGVANADRPGWREFITGAVANEVAAKSQSEPEPEDAEATDD